MFDSSRRRVGKNVVQISAVTNDKGSFLKIALQEMRSADMPMVDVVALFYPKDFHSAMAIVNSAGLDVFERASRALDKELQRIRGV